MSLKPHTDHRCENWSIDQTDSWKQLQAQQTRNVRLDSLFEQDPDRFKQFSIPFEGHIFDFSKNQVTTQTLDLFKGLCHEAHLFERIEALFKGDIANETEQRPALHCTLRSADSTPSINGE